MIKISLLFKDIVHFHIQLIATTSRGIRIHYTLHYDIQI